MATPSSPHSILDFWFGRPDDPDYGQPRLTWFTRDPAFDALIRARYRDILDSALNGELEHWNDSPRGTLAHLLVLDQLMRNAFRDSARAYAGDEQARRLAIRLVDSGDHLLLAPIERQFAYLPFEHAEDIDHQNRAIALFTALARDEPSLASSVDWARRHRDIIVRFGRFPHRNEVLGRDSTLEEAQFLTEPGSSF